MKIGIYDPYFDDLGGGEKYMMTLAECLAKSNDVSIFWDNASDLVELKKRFSLNLDNVSLTKNIFGPHVSFFDRALASRSYDVIIILSDGSLPYLLSKKLFVHIQQPLEAKHVRSWKAKIKLSKINKVFYNSEYTKSFNKDLMPQVPSCVIYPPVDLSAKKVKKENIILHVGRFRVKNVGVENYKKQDVMIEAFKQMIDKGLKNWKFIIAAGVREQDKEKFALMQQAAKGYPIEFLINKSNDELWEMYSKAKIYWHASGFGEDLAQHPEFAEHFGISTVEAMGAGVVPVVINAGGQKEIITEKVDGLLWNTLSELQQKTLILTKDNSVLEKMAEDAQKRAKDFSKEMFCKEVNALVHS